MIASGRVDARDALAEHLERLDPRRLAGDVDMARVGAYRGYTELVERWLELGRAGAGLRIVGSSAGRMPLVALVFGPDLAPLTSALIAGIHPIEWIGVETMLALLERLAADPPRDRRIIAFPLVNVDGYRKVEADLRAGERRWRRYNARGVDLNRNFPTHFRERRTRLFAGRGGPGPLSEPESAAIATALDQASARSRIDVALSLHSFGRMILVPYGGRWRAPAAAAELHRAARSLRARLPEGYAVRQASRWVPGAFARGMEIDHLHERYGAISLLVECSGGGLRLRDPMSWIHPFRWYNPPDPAEVAGNLATALEPFVRAGS